MAARIYVDNDQVIKLDGLKDQDGNAITSATVEATILDAAKQPVADGGPITLTHDSDGNYSATLDKAVGLTVNRAHYLEVTATSGSADATWRKKLVARERDE